MRAPQGLTREHLLSVPLTTPVCWPAAERVARLAPRQAPLAAGAPQGLRDPPPLLPVVEEKPGGASPQVPAEVLADWPAEAQQLERAMAQTELEAAIAAEWQVALDGPLASAAQHQQQAQARSTLRRKPPA